MTTPGFERFQTKLSRNVYGSLKGRIRLELIEKDIREFCPEFNRSALSVLDVGCGEGAFAAICLEAGHRVHLIDASESMIQTAANRIMSVCGSAGNVRFDCVDFLSWVETRALQYDLVLMHGAAEWMDSAIAAIEGAATLVRPGGYLSLLMFNRDMHAFKKGVNGHLLGNDPNNKQKLFPPNAQSVHETAMLLSQQPGKILLQSGIRIFYGFFREIIQSSVSEEQWMAQESAFYRQLPFSLMGHHTHFVWKKDMLCSDRNPGI